MDEIISSSDTRHDGLSNVPYLLGISWYSFRPFAQCHRTPSKSVASSDDGIENDILVVSRALAV